MAKDTKSITPSGTFKSISVAAAIILSLWNLPSFAQDHERVTFPSSPIQASAFRIRKAAEKGVTLAPMPGIELPGTLFRPAGNGPFPAVVVLLGVDGVQASHINWSKNLADWGYIALLVDSFEARGGRDHLDTFALNMPDDAVSAFSYLTSLPIVKKEQIGFLGFSLGGSGLFTVLHPANKNVPEGFSVKAAVALYPRCLEESKLVAPMLILAGGNDKYLSLAPCRAFVEQGADVDAPANLHIFKGATHFFDNPNYSKNVDEIVPNPIWYKDNDYNKEAHLTALHMVRDHFDRLLVNN